MSMRIVVSAQPRQRATAIKDVTSHVQISLDLNGAVILETDCTPGIVHEPKLPDRDRRRDLRT